MPLPPTSAAQFELPQGILDVPDIAMVPLDQQVESLIRLCSGSLRVDDASDDLFGELKGDVAIVRMQVAGLLDTLPATNASRIRLAGGLLGACKDKSAGTLRAEVSAAIRASTDVREPGTHIDALVRTKVAAVTGVSAAVPLVGAFGATLNALAVVLDLSLGARRHPDAQWPAR